MNPNPRLEQFDLDDDLVLSEWILSNVFQMPEDTLPRINASARELQTSFWGAFGEVVPLPVGEKTTKSEQTTPDVENWMGILDSVTMTNLATLNDQALIDLVALFTDEKEKD